MIGADHDRRKIAKFDTRSVPCHKAAPFQQKDPFTSSSTAPGLKSTALASGWRKKHGARSRRGWRKLNLALDADSGEIIAHVMTDQDAGDASQVEPLLGQIDTPIGQLRAERRLSVKQR
jgi:hypothetical protein